MLTAAKCLNKYGDPRQEKNMSALINNYGDAIPQNIYMNNDLKAPFIKAMSLLEAKNLLPEIKTWDGCFNIRNRMHKKSGPLSLHAWGLAIDINAAWNRPGYMPKQSSKLIECFLDAGFDWGGYWAQPDGMHFQLATLP